jgi:hypothetical protein
MEETLKCDCGRDAEYFSLGGSVFCKKCADDLGLGCGETNRIENYPAYLKRKADHEKRKMGGK